VQPGLRLAFDEIQRLQHAQRPARENVVTDTGGAQEIFHVGHAPRRIVGFGRDFRLPLRAGIERQYAELVAQHLELQTEHRSRHQPAGNEDNGLLAMAGFEVMQAQTVATSEKLAADRRGRRRKAGHAADQKGQDTAEFHAQSVVGARFRESHAIRPRQADAGHVAMSDLHFSS